MEPKSEIKLGPRDRRNSFTSSDNDETVETARASVETPADGNRSFLARMLAGLGRLVTRSGQKDVVKRKRRPKRREADESAE